MSLNTTDGMNHGACLLTSILCQNHMLSTMLCGCSRCFPVTCSLSEMNIKIVKEM